jgi:primosomal protein N' (replication factor Y)
MKNFYVVDLNFDKSKFPYFSNTLINSIKKAINNNKKTILYINKRGMYDLLVCTDCNYLKKCPRCDIALSIHKKPEVLMCHHCNYTEEIKLTCEKCAGANLKKI